MIWLDIVTVEQKTGPKRFMRIRDDQYPGEEMLIPLAEDDQPAATASQPKRAPLQLTAGELLIDPFIA